MYPSHALAVSAHAALIAASLALAPLSAVFATTDEAWIAFRADVEQQCRAAAADALEEIRVHVDPFGSQHYGLALLEGYEHGGDGQTAIICVYDKHDKTVELGTAMTMPPDQQPALP